jgi:serine/threonine protein kinase
MLQETICGRYKLIKELARGGFGTTFLAKDALRPGEPYCVVKQLTPKFDDDANLKQAQRLFEEEAKVLQQLGTYDRIPRLEAYFEEDEKFYLVQEFIAGDNLRDEFDKIWTEKETIELLLELLNILVFVQQNNYIHRDINPTNIIRRSCDRKLVLIDFGAVKEKINSQIVRSQANSSLTVCIGSPGYMPLEQADGKPRFASDLYAVGKVAIQALTGVSPRLLLENDDGEVVWRDRLPKGAKYDPQLLDFLDKMVRSQFQERYYSATEALENLEKMINSSRSSKNFSRQSNIKLLNQRILKQFLLSILSGSAIISLLFFLLSNVLQFEKFLTYKNVAHGIKVEYPKSWKVEKKDDLFEKGTIFQSPLENKRDRFQERISIFIENLSSPSLSLAQYTDNYIRTIKTGVKTSNFDKSESLLAQQPAVKLVYSYDEGKNKMERMKVWTIKNNRAYIFTYTAEKKSYNRFLNKAERMISSLAIE